MARQQGDWGKAPGKKASAPAPKSSGRRAWEEEPATSGRPAPTPSPRPQAAPQPPAAQPSRLPGRSRTTSSSSSSSRPNPWQSSARTPDSPTGQNPWQSGRSARPGERFNPWQSTSPLIAQQERDERVADQQVSKRDQFSESLMTNLKDGSSIPQGAEIRAGEMTQEKYDALTPAQRAAVDFNTALVEAVARDKELQRPAARTPEAESYDVAVKRLFGDQESTTYAPNTVALLDAVGIDVPDDTLDDYLNLRSAVFSTDLGSIETTGRVQGQVPAGTLPARATTVTQLAQKTADLLESFNGPGFSTQAGSVPRDGFQAPDAAGRLEEFFRPAASSMGARRQQDAPSGDVAAVLGFGASPQDEGLRLVFEDVAKREFAGSWSHEDLLAGLQEMGYTPEQFWQYAGTRLQQYEDASKTDPNAVLGLTPGTDYLSPDEIRSTLGLSR